MALFLSTFVNKIDKKGRVSIPAPFRHGLDSTFVLFKSHQYPALEASTMDRMQLLSDRVDTLELFSQEREDLSTFLFANAQAVSIDGDGRILLPSAFREYARINNEVIFVGQGKTFQMWNPESFQTRQKESHSRIQNNPSRLRIDNNV